MSNRFNRRQFVGGSAALATAGFTKLIGADGLRGSCEMNVAKSLHIAAPYPHVAVCATDQIYTDNSGLRLLETVAYEAKYRGNTKPCLRYYRKEAFRRISPDNGRTWTVKEPSYEQNPTDAEHEQFWPPSHFHDPETGFIVAISMGFRLYQGGKETYDLALRSQVPYQMYVLSPTCSNACPDSSPRWSHSPSLPYGTNTKSGTGSRKWRPSLLISNPSGMRRAETSGEPSHCPCKPSSTFPRFHTLAGEWGSLPCPCGIGTYASRTYARVLV